MTEFWLSFHGRIPRRSFWLGILALMVVDFVAHLGLIALLGSAAYDAANRESFLLKLVDLVVTSPLLWPMAALFLKRIHDFGQGWVLFSLIAGVVVLFVGLDLVGAEVPAYGAGLVFLVLWIAVGATRGMAGANQYGPDPLEQRA